MPKGERNTQLDVKAELEKIRRNYQENVDVEGSLNALVYGDLGTRKTSFITTGPRPVYIASFDPGGTKIPEVRKGVEEGWCFVESFEGDSWTDPKQFDLWRNRMLELRKADFFSSIGTFGVDAVGNWLRSAMNKRVSREKRENGVPARQDYLAVGIVLIDWVIQLSVLPCHFIMTGHIARDEDGVTGAIQTSINVFKSLRGIIPELFGEVYVTQVHKKPNERPDVLILTENDGRYKAKTRIGGHGIFDHEEKMDIKQLLKKAGLNAGDKT